MHDRAHARQCAVVAGAMVIRDDDLDPKSAGLIRLLDGSDAAVDGDDEVDALAGQRRNRLGVDAVALLHAMRHVGAHGGVRLIAVSARQMIAVA
jgi:hypothetical protein